MSARILVTGAGGMLGNELVEVLRNGGRLVTALDRANLDITDADAVQRAVAGHDAVVNCAAYTRVDDAEKDEATAFAVNAVGAGIVADAARAAGARMVQLSTDYVFDGTARIPYPEAAPLCPLSAYGRSKAAGEEAVLRVHPDGGYVVRTAWLYGRHGTNFATTMLALADKHDTVSVVTDQVGQPTWARDVAEQIVLLLGSDAPAGRYHATNSGVASWYDFARAVFDANGIDPERVRQTVAARFPRPAPRPNFSVLGHGAWAVAGLAPLRPWRTAFAAAVADGLFNRQ